MNDVSKYDKNFRAEKINDDEFEFHSFTEFKLEGFLSPNTTTTQALNI